MKLFRRTQNIYDEGSKKISEITHHILRLLPFWLAGALTALVATGYAQLFTWAEHLSWQLYKYAGVWFIAVPPVFFVVSWILVEKLAPNSSGSGIPQLMASVDMAHQNKHQPIPQFLSLRIIIVKILSSIIGVLGGGSIGREGPTLQISGSIFHLVNKYWTLSEIQNRSAFLMAGAASGLASAFNTPLGGIVYVVEELAKSHLNSFRTGVLHAVICAGIISQMIMGPYLYLGYPKVGTFQFLFMWKYLLVAIFAAVIVGILTQLLKAVVIYRSRLKIFKYKLLFTILTAMIFSVFAVYISESIMGPGQRTLNALLFSDTTASLTDVISRLFGSVLTYANGGAGGIFAPTLSLGGAAGSFFSGILQFKLGALAVLIGMTSGLAALTHSPLTSFILILEMTDRYSSIFPLMLAAIVGHGLSRLISKQSFYEFVCERIIAKVQSENIR